MQIYAASVSDLDEQIGRLMTELKRLGKDENTLVFFSSDNGPETIYDISAGHSGVGHAGPFRGRKRSLYEGGIRVPAIARWPGHIPAGRVDNRSVLAAVDWLPALCRIAGLPAPSSLDGEDMSGALFGGAQARTRPLMWENRLSIPFEPWNRSPMLAMRDGDWKLLINPDGKRAELYNVVEDPDEHNNLREKHPQKLQEMTEALLGWRKTLPQGPAHPEAGVNDYSWPGMRSGSQGTGEK